MNKHFFKINHKIRLIDILKILGISKEDFYSFQSNAKISLEDTLILDFVSFENLEKNKLSFFTNAKCDLNKVSSGICIVKKENLVSKSKNTSIEGRKLQGKVISTFVNGKELFKLK